MRYLTNGEHTLEALKSNLPQVEPYLFNLADQLVENATQASWDLLLCDDIGGRLPTYFIRRVLTEQGHPLPTRFVAGSKFVHQKFGNEAYENYFSSITKQLGKSSVNVLISTEATGHGGTMEFLKDRLAPFASKIETAAVVNKFPSQATTDYAGAVGMDAATSVFFAFEAPPITTVRGKFMRAVKPFIPESVSPHIPAFAKRAASQADHALVGLSVTGDNPLPVASRYSSPNVCQLAYLEMNKLVAKYSKNQGTLNL